MAIQFSPSTNWPTPNHQPRASAERSDGALSISQSKRGEGEQGQRPQPERREAERGDEAGEEGEAEELHRPPLWRSGRRRRQGTIRSRQSPPSVPK